MPTYHVEMLEGRTIEQKRKLVQEITRITVEVLGYAGGVAACDDNAVSDPECRQKANAN